MQAAFGNERRHTLGGNDCAEHAVGGEQRSHLFKQHAEGQRVGMACGGTARVGVLQAVLKERRIGHYAVEARSIVKLLYCRFKDLHPTCEPAVCHVFPCLTAGIAVKIHSLYFGIVKTLRHHQGYQSCACADVKNPFPSIGPRAYQHAVGSNLHGASFLLYVKLFKCKAQNVMFFIELSQAKEIIGSYWNIKSSLKNACLRSAYSMSRLNVVSRRSKAA